ncbi:MAG: ABC transporter permease [Armatimonadota bacterium]|nr:ABC transporter permease [Armatimonadota bacterium]
MVTVETTAIASAARRWTRLKSRWSHMAYLFRRNPLSMVGLGIVLFFLALAVLAPAIVTHDPLAPDPVNQAQPPGRTHLFGTDGLGMDVFSRVIAAARVDMYVAIASVTLAILVGLPLGAVAGYFGGVVDDIVMRALDSQQAFPSYILALAIVTATGQSLTNIILVIAFVNYPIYARLVRAQMLSVKESQYADAARVLGNPRWRIIFRHLVPNCLGPVYVQGSLNAGWALLLAASLSFIGLGVRLPTPEWGLMVSQGSRHLVFGEWWMSFFPGLALFLAVLGFNLLGDGLQDMFDPKRR